MNIISDSSPEGNARLEIDEDRAAHLRVFLSRKEHNRLFSEGACFHFSVRAFAKGIGQLQVVPGSCGDPSKIDHVFLLLADGRAFDRLGYRTVEAVLAERQARFCARPAGESEISAYITSLRLPADLNAEIYLIADNLIQQICRSFQASG